MRIAIDVRKINDFGIGTYLRNLIRHLPASTPERLLLCSAIPGRGAPEVALAPSSFISSRPQLLPSEHWSISLALRRIDADLFHAPHYVLPALVPCPSVVTVHDVIHLLFPQYLPSRFASRYARAMIGSAVSRARLVMTVSQASKKTSWGSSTSTSQDLW
jgi:alpha-1,3-rhamnosyl/mannosyltransferase